MLSPTVAELGLAQPQLVLFDFTIKLISIAIFCIPVDNPLQMKITNSHFETLSMSSIRCIDLLFSFLPCLFSSRSSDLILCPCAQVLSCPSGGNISPTPLSPPHFLISGGSAGHVIGRGKAGVLPAPPLLLPA